MHQTAGDWVEAIMASSILDERLESKGRVLESLRTQDQIAWDPCGNMYPSLSWDISFRINHVFFNRSALL